MSNFSPKQTNNNNKASKMGRQILETGEKKVYRQLEIVKTNLYSIESSGLLWEDISWNTRNFLANCGRELHKYPINIHRNPLTFFSTESTQIKVK